MTESDSMEPARSIDTVIRSFTDAELALRELSGAIDGLRSAGEQLDEARNDQAAARAAMGETTAAVRDVGERVEGVVTGLRDTVAVLSTIDPDRLWRHLEQIESDVRSASDALSARLADSVAESNVRLDAIDSASDALSARFADSVAESNVRLDAIDRRGKWAVGLSLAASVLALVASTILVGLIAGAFSVPNL